MLDKYKIKLFKKIKAVAECIMAGNLIQTS